MKEETIVPPTAEKTEKKEGEEDNEPAPIGNGGRTDRYIWTQTLEVFFNLNLVSRNVHLY